VTVTITQQAATVAIRAATDVDEIAGPVESAIAVIWPAAVALVQHHAPEAPDPIHNAAAVRLLGWLYEADPAERGGDRALQTSGAFGLLGPWRVHRAGAIGAADGQAAPVPTPGAIRPGEFTPQPAFAFYAQPTLLDVSAGPDGAEVPAAGDGAIFQLLPETEIRGPILAGEPFWTFWEGAIAMESEGFRGTDRSRFRISLRTDHAFGDEFAKRFTHTRTVEVPAANNGASIALAEFFSVSTVRVGSFTPPGQAPVEITADDLAQPSKIAYALEVQAFNRSTNARQTDTLERFESSAIGTVSVQWQQAVQTGGVAPAPGGGELPPRPGAGTFVLVDANGVLRWIEFPLPS